MAKITITNDDLKKFKANFTKLTNSAKKQLYKDLAHEFTARLLEKTIKRTPVGRYHKGSGKVGGTLKGNWRVGELTHQGKAYHIEVYNPINYAQYVEFGHRTADHNGWVEGHFMLSKSELELQRDAHLIIVNKVKKLF